MTEKIFTNAKLILENDVISGSLVIKNGQVKNIQEGNSAVPSAFDCEGAYLAAGLIELHTDNLERHVEPRPKVPWSLDQAIPPHYAELASCGMTTVFDAIPIGSISECESLPRITTRQSGDEVSFLRKKYLKN